MDGLGYTTEYTEDETNRHESGMVAEDEAVGGSSPEDEGELLSEGDMTVGEMLKKSQVGSDEQNGEENYDDAVVEYNFADDDHIGHVGIGYGLVGKPDYDLE